MEWRIPFADLDYGAAEEAAVQRVLRSRWLTMGEETAAFEAEFAAAVGVGHAVAVSNCTDGLHLAMLACGVGPGDEVIVPSLSFVATANCVRYVGGVPVFADVTSEEDLTISPADVAAKITAATKAVIVMHYGGYPCDMDPIRRLAAEAGITVVEDAAHATATTYKGTRTGALGQIAAFSFFSNKNLATGEGGMVTCFEPEMAAQMRLKRSHGMTAQTLDRFKGHAYSYDVVTLGHNFRLTEIEAALGRAQLARLPEMTARRRAVVERYLELLVNVPGVGVPFADFGMPAWRYEGESSYHLFVVLLEDAEVRARVMDALKAAGIQSSIHYPPIHSFTDIRADIAAGRARAEGLPLTDDLGGRLLSLPLASTFEPEVADSVVGVMREVLGS